VGVDSVQPVGDATDVRHGVPIAVRAPQIVAAVAGCLLVGCLPVGDPPAGHQVFVDRTLTGVFLSPSETDNTPSHLFATGPLRNPPSSYPLSFQPMLADLYTFPDPNPAASAGGLATMQPVLENDYIPSANPVDYVSATDILGRLLVVEFNPITPQMSGFQVWRFDPVSGSRAFLANANVVNGESFLLSPGRTRGYVYQNGSATEFELDDQRSFASINGAAFIGEDFYYLVYQYEDATSSTSYARFAGTNIYRIRPSAQPELLLASAGEMTFEVISGDRVPQLLLSLNTDGGLSPFALLDTETLVTTSLPRERGQASFVSTSSDGHWLAFSTTIPSADPEQPQNYGLFLYDWTAREYATLDAAHLGLSLPAAMEWRPGRAELWIYAFSNNLAVWRPDASLKKGIQATPTLYARAPDGNRSIFTRDGRHWFSTDGNDRPTISVGSADNPTGPRWPLNPLGTVTTSHWETDDGRVLFGAWTIDENRKDYYLVDADAGTSYAVASAGHLIALGHTRALALLNWEVSRAIGDLTLIDLASNEKTLLAEDVYAVDVDRGKSADVPPGTDVLAPGTRVAYLMRNRLASPWDGLWVASLP
jgi:hypothetical protein